MHLGFATFTRSAVPCWVPSITSGSRWQLTIRGLRILRTLKVMKIASLKSPTFFVPAQNHGNTVAVAGLDGVIDVEVAHCKTPLVLLDTPEHAAIGRSAGILHGMRRAVRSISAR